MAYQFLVYVPREGVPTLTEGGVYCDDSAILASASDYRGNNFARGAADLDALNSRGEFATPPYELRDAIDGVDAGDADVLSSLVDWQLSAILDGAAELGTLSNASAVYRERGRRVVDSAVAPCFVLLDVTGTAEHYAGDARAALHLAGENSTIWHKPGGAERPYQLDAFRLNALADMETGRALMGRGSDGTDSAGRLAEAIAAAFGRDVPDTLARELGRIAGISERLADAKASVSEWQAEARIADGNAATWRAIAEARQGDIAPAIRPQPGERVSPDGAAIRSNAAWRALAETAIAARDTAESRYRAESLACNELRGMRATLESNIATYREQRDAQSARATEAEARATDNGRARDAAQGRANNAESLLASRETRWIEQVTRHNALFAAHEELRAALGIVARYAKGAE